MDIRILCCIGLMLLATNHVFSADIKKWVDPDGQTHFGYLSPHGQDAIQVTPDIITTAPSTNNSLKDIMRPGELRMIKNYEKRGKRLIKAKRRAYRKAQRRKKNADLAQKKCKYHQDKIDYLERKLRNGCKQAEKIKIEERLAKHNLQVEEYCN